MKLYIVSSNKDKIREAQSILPFSLEPVGLEIDEVQDVDIDKIILKKASEAFKKIKEPVIVDDVGVYISAWNGFPGPFSKFLDKAGGNELILKMLKDEKNRKVTVKAAIGFHDGKKAYSFIGEIEGEVSSSIRGTNGWGFDPIIIPRGLNKTFGEMEAVQKNKISHRRKALEKLKLFLEENGYI